MELEPSQGEVFFFSKRETSWSCYSSPNEEGMFHLQILVHSHFERNPEVTGHHMMLYPRVEGL